MKYFASGLMAFALTGLMLIGHGAVLGSAVGG